jgi:hypothetical protein
MPPLQCARIHDYRVPKKFERHLAFRRPTCRYAATNFDPAEAGTPAVGPGAAGPRWRIKSRPFSRTKRGIRTSPAALRLRFAHLVGDKTPAKRLKLSKNAGSCCLGSRRPTTTKHTVTILLCICQGEFTPKFPAETGGLIGIHCTRRLGVELRVGARPQYCSLYLEGKCFLSAAPLGLGRFLRFSQGSTAFHPGLTS